MKIMSISSGHDASLSVVDDGKVSSYLKAERYSGIKHDSDERILIDIASKEGLFKDIDYLIYSNDSPQEVKSKQNEKLISKSRRKCSMIEPKGQHHLFHASHAFYDSGFEEALVVVIDSTGAYLRKHSGYECVSVYQTSYPYNFKPLYKRYYSYDHETLIAKTPSGVDFEIHNILDGSLDVGNLYNSAAIAIGADPDNCGKAMGLSCYGKSILDFDLKGYEVINNIKKYFKDYPDLLEYLLTIDNDHNNSFDLTITKDNFQFFADYCYEVQRQCQEQVIDLVGKYVSNTGIKNVCISGGYAMNIITNYELMQKYPEVNFYFDPVCDDSNLTIGSSYYFYRMKTKDMTIYPVSTTSYHGYPIELPLGATSCIESETSIKEVASLLAQNKSVAVFYGQAEAGQRALGNRSILFNALNPSAKEIVNDIKKREWYRPFAAMVLEEDAHLYFDNVRSNPHMTACFPVISDIIPGVTHVDGTCRIQTINSDHFLYDLLLEFKKLTGHGIVLNTSFNLAGQPLVEKPVDAFRTLCKSSLGFLWFYESNRLFKTNF